jgi:integrase/recombinase XerD
MNTNKASVRLHLYTSKIYSDVTSPIVLMHTINGKRVKRVLGRCMEADWDPVKCRVRARVPKSSVINNHLSSEFAKAEEAVYELKAGRTTVSEVLGTRVGSLTLGDALALELVRLEKEFKSGYYDKIAAIRKQIPDTTIPIEEIDDKWFNRFIKRMGGDSVGNSNNTIKKKIKLLRGVILRYSSKGVTKEVKAVSIATTRTVKQKLTGAELALLENLELGTDMLGATRDLFLMQVYLRGVRVGDVLQARTSQFKDDRFHYQADKTGRIESVKLIPSALAIVERWQALEHDRLFPFFTWSPMRGVSAFENERARLKHKEVCTTGVNKYLKVLAVMAGIKKPLTSHIARHTFARMAIDKINNPMITMELLGHSSLAVHQAYLNDLRKDDVLDAAADDIFG